jgi:plastocyanin
MKRIQVVFFSLLILASGLQPAVAGEITGKVKAKGVRNSGDAVIYVAKIAGKTFPVPKEHARMDQKNLKFVPHVLPIMAGTTVDFVNSDDVLHNVFSPDKCCDKFNLGSWPKGQSKSYTFAEPGCAATLLCNVHPEMEGFVFVVETPYYAVSAADGSFEIKGVPAGKYTVKIWHEKLKGQDVAVEVPEKGKATVNFEIHR